MSNPQTETVDLASLPIFQPAQTSPVAARFTPDNRPSGVNHNLPATSKPPQRLQPDLAFAVPAASVPSRMLPIPPAAQDWGLVSEFRKLASQRLSKIAETITMGPDEQHEQGRKIIADILQEHIKEQFRQGAPAMTATVERWTAEAVFDALFRYGRLQPLLERDDIEDIECYGAARTLVKDKDGNYAEADPIADSDTELIEFIQFIVKRSESNARKFDFANPAVHMRLDGGARLAAVAWTTPYPIMSIRRHRLRSVTLDSLVQLHSISPNLAGFLRAAVRARRSIVVSGEQGAGKTTLLRALAAEIDPWEKIATFETEYELFLHELGDQHRRTVAFEVRPGGGERGIDGRPAGEVTMAEEMFDAYRLLIERYIVGEARGMEVLQMIEAMQSGAGTLSTTHARSARATFDKLVTLATRAPDVDEAYASRALAGFIDLIVHIDRKIDARGQYRYVDEVIGLDWTGDGVKYTDIYRPGADGHAIPAFATAGDRYKDLAAWGFDIDEYLRAIPRGAIG